MSISIKSNTDGVSGALQVNGTDVLTFTSSGNINVTGNVINSINSKTIYGPNTTWGAYLHVGGEGINGITRTATLASVVTTNGNVHIDAGTDKQTYINYYSGTGGILFGNGANDTSANVSAGGAFTGTNFIGPGTGLTGTAASLSIGGNAATATSATTASNTTGYSKYITFDDGPRDLSNRLPNTFARSVLWDFVGAGTANGSGNYGGVMTFAPYAGTTASTGDSSYQLAFANTTGVNASGQPKLSIRNGIDTTWNAWYTLLHSGNWSSYVAGTATTFTATQTFANSGIVLKGSSTGSTTLTSANASATSYTVTIPAETMTLGFRNIPPVGTKATSYTLTTADVGKYVQLTTGGSVTIPTATFAEGDIISLFNNTTGAITVTCSALTTYVSGTDTVVVSPSLAARGVATILFISSTVCVISGDVTGALAGLYSFTNATFTPADSAGTVGPSLTQARTGMTGTPTPSGWNTNTSYFNTSSGVMLWTVPATRTYRITCAGAQGGSGKYTTYYGGYGRIMIGGIPLTQGEVISIVVGQKGGYNVNGSAGGGGGSFVFRTSGTRTTANVLIAAGGGGGGGGNSTPLNGRSGVTTTSGDTNSSGSAGGTSGAGGPAYSGGGGGGGITSGGGVGVDTAAGGLAITGTANGGRGGSCAASQTGSFNYNSLGNDQGGFGGGGGGEWCLSGAVGGGGGYSGGAGNTSSGGVGGGGGSFIGNGVTLISNTGTNGVTTLTERAGLNGYVLIEAI